MALKGYLALVKVASTPIAFTDEATSTSDNQTYTITNATKVLWDLDTAVVVEDATVPTTEAYTLSRLTGTITFDSVDAGRVITVTGAYVATTTIAEAKSFSFSGASDALDTTKFQDTFKEFKVGNVTATAEIGRFLELDDLFVDMLLDGERKIIEYYPNSGLDPIMFYGVANSRSVDAPQAGLIDETISFNVTTEIEV